MCLPSLPGAFDDMFEVSYSIRMAPKRKSCLHSEIGCVDCRKQWRREAQRRYDAKPESKIKHQLAHRKASMEPEQWERYITRKRAYAKTTSAKERLGIYRSDPTVRAQMQRSQRKAKGVVDPEMAPMLLEFQNNLCAICDTVLSTPKNTCADHCHVTGKMRGMLCRACNTGIGQLRDAPSLLRRALDYLKHPPADKVRLGTESGKRPQGTNL